MADPDDPKAGASAEQAYAAASEAITDKPIEFPAKPKRGRKPAGAARPAASAELNVPEPAVPEPAVPEPAVPEPAVSEPTVSEPPIAVAPLAEPSAAVKTVPKPRRARAVEEKPARVAKPVVKRAVAKPATVAPAKLAVTKPRMPAIQKIKTAPKTAKTSPAAAQNPTLLAQLKEIPMDMTATVTEAVSGAQEKAKEAFTKTTAAFGEYGEFAKGNVEAFIESGKILASGLQ